MEINKKKKKIPLYLLENEKKWPKKTGNYTRIELKNRRITRNKSFQGELVTFTRLRSRFEIWLRFIIG